MASQERYEDGGFDGDTAYGQPPAADGREPTLAPLPPAPPRPATADPVGGSQPAQGGTSDLVGGANPSTTPQQADTVDTTGPAGTAATESERTPLLPPDETQRFRQHWESIQVGFVDEPRQSVRQADELVADLMRQLAEVFAQQRSSLEADWDRGDDVSTEDFRLTLQRYRSFFQRLLAA